MDQASKNNSGEVINEEKTDISRKERKDIEV